MVLGFGEIHSIPDLNEGEQRKIFNVFKLIPDWNIGSERWWEFILKENLKNTQWWESAWFYYYQKIMYCPQILLPGHPIMRGNWMGRARWLSRQTGSSSRVSGLIREVEAVCSCLVFVFFFSRRQQGAHSPPKKKRFSCQQWSKVKFFWNNQQRPLLSTRKQEITLHF